jgi:MFS transporter, OPA family, glycerol-3-phosphate transporter
MGIDIPAEFREAAYRHRRFQNWMLVGLLYSFFYMTRYNFSALAPTLREVFGWTKGDLGIFETLLPLVYGLSVVLNAPLADKFGGRKAFLFGAVGVVIMNLIFGAFCFGVETPSVWAGEGKARALLQPAVLISGLSGHTMAWIMAIVWAINGYFQSFGALSIVKINAQWFHLRERGTFGAIFGVLIRFGLILGFSGAPLLASLLSWQWAFWIPAMCVGVLFFLNLFFVVETPEEAGFSGRDTGDAVIGDEGQKVTVMVVIRKVVSSWQMWMIALASMMIGMVRRSILDASWFPLYFTEVHGVGKNDAPYQVTAWGIAILGIIGGFVLGGMSDRVYKSRRAPVVVIGFLGMIACLGLFYGSDVLALGSYGASACLMMLSFFVNGAHGLIGGAASMDFGGRKGAATAAGLFDGMQYLAAAFTAPMVAWITTNASWQWWKLWAIPFAVVGAIVMSTLWNATPRGRGGH